MKLRRSFHMVLALLFLAGCGGEGGSGDPSDASAPPERDGGAIEPDFDAGPTLPSTGCGATAPSEGSKALMVGSESRAYRLNLPAGYDEGRAYPLVFGFHGAGSGAAVFESDFYGGLLPVAGGEAILIFPQALQRPLPLPNEVQWQIDGSEDIAFFDAMLAEAKSSLCVDEARIFATGHSSGGYFTNRLGCERGDALRAIAPLAGGGPFTALTGPCVGQVAAWLEHGVSDVVVTVDKGEASRDHWLAENGCASSSASTTPSGCVAYDSCEPGYPVHWCESAGGHEPRPAFTASGSWAFFSRF